MPVINILRDGGQVKFDPPILEGAVVGDRVFWRNLDPMEEHWITLKGKPQDLWFRFALARYVRGQPADTTREVVLQQEMPLVYVCSLHDGENGEIRFAAAAIA